MTDEEEWFIFFVSCLDSLNSAWMILKKITVERENCLAGPAFRYALIEYSKPYRQSRGFKRKYKLGNTFVPIPFLALHERLLAERDQLHAHSDLTIKDARLAVHEFGGRRYAQISQNYLSGFDNLRNINELIALIEGTLDLMCLEHTRLEQALQV